jgi:hypothetical protein
MNTSTSTPIAPSQNGAVSPDGHPATNQIVIGALVLDREVLRDALVGALSDPTVAQKVAEVLAARGAAANGTVPRFMNTKEYAARVKISARTLSYEMQGMTEGVHYSRSGRRVRFHVKEADEYIAQSKRMRATEQQPKVDLAALARQEAARRRVKSPEGRK